MFLSTFSRNHLQTLQNNLLKNHRHQEENKVKLPNHQKAASHRKVRNPRRVKNGQEEESHLRAAGVD